MGTFSENLTIFLWGATLLAGGSLVAWYAYRVKRELEPISALYTALFVLTGLGAGVAGMGAVMAIPSGAILLYLSFGWAWLIVPLVLLVTLVVFVEQRIRSARRTP